MRKRLGIAAAVLVLAGVGYWWLTSDTNPQLDPARLAGPGSFVKNDGDAEPSDAIEPLVVDRVARGLPALPEPRAAHMEALPRVVLAPGMTQPARPDAESSGSRWMPYADEVGDGLNHDVECAMQATVGVAAWTAPWLPRHQINGYWEFQFPPWVDPHAPFSKSLPQ